MLPEDLTLITETGERIPVPASLRTALYALLEAQRGYIIPADGVPIPVVETFIVDIIRYDLARAFDFYPHT